MATGTINSAEVAAGLACSMPDQYSSALGGKVRVYTSTVTTTAIDAGSTINLIKLPAGRHRVYGFGGGIKQEAVGSGVTLALGVAAYKNQKGEDVSASTANILAATSIATASGTALSLANAANAYVDIDTIAPVYITGTTGGATMTADKKVYVELLVASE